MVSAAGYAAAAGTGAFAAADIQSEITDGKHNYIRDTVFRGNQKTYNTAHSIVDAAGIGYTIGGAAVSSGKFAKTGSAGKTGAKSGTSIKTNVNKNIKQNKNIEEITTNLGKKIDITTSTNHRVSKKNPGISGPLILRLILLIQMETLKQEDGMMRMVKHIEMLI